MNKRRLVLYAFSASAVLALALTASRRYSQATSAHNGGSATTAETPSILINPLKANRGVVFNTAAINEDATVAVCFNCVPQKTFQVSTGEYQVDVGHNVQAISPGTRQWPRGPGL